MEIKHLRKSFFEIVKLLSCNQMNFWVARGLSEQIGKGVIDDDENHDIDFHLLVQDRNKLKTLLSNNNYQIRQEKPYKIQILGKTDNRKIEFVFLEEQGDNYIHQSKGVQYSHHKKLFGNHICRIGDVKIRIPWPLEEYLNN